MTRYIRAGLVCIAMMLLAGCSFFSHSVTWSKPGVTDAQAQDDLATCTEQAQVQTDRDTSIDKDHRGRGHRIERGGHFTAAKPPGPTSTRTGSNPC